MIHKPKRRPVTQPNPVATISQDEIIVRYSGGDEWGVMRGSALNHPSLAKRGIPLDANVRIIVVGVA